MEKGFDAIVVLGAGITVKGNLSMVAKSRMDKAIELYMSGAAPRVVITGRRESAVMRRYALKKGVGKRDLFTEGKSLDTIGNAFFAKKLFLAPNGWRRVVVVTSIFHSVRAGFVFRKVLGKEYSVDVISSRRVLSDKMFGLKLQSERKLLLLTRLIASLIADGDMAAVENFLRKSPVYRL